jgi:solute carrier family 25 carnitine/acylcarnitine transporter 20/29
MVVETVLAGCAAGVLGTIIGYPLDSIKTRMQTAKGGRYASIPGTFTTILREEGLVGFYRGVGAPLSALTLLNMLNFSNYAYFRRILGVSDETLRNQNVDLRVFAAGAVSGPAASLISTPFELLKTQLQVQKEFTNSLVATSGVIRQYGFPALYRGHAVNTSREMLFLGTYFFVYEHSKTKIEKVATPYMSSHYAIPIAGGVSGAIGWFLSFPLDCIKSNMQGVKLSAPRKSSFAHFSAILSDRGVLGLYRGVGPSVARAFIVSSTRFTAYEFVVGLLRHRI